MWGHRGNRHAIWALELLFLAAWRLGAAAGEYNHLQATRLFVYTETAVRPDLLFTEAANFYTSFPRNFRAYNVPRSNGSTFTLLQNHTSPVRGWVGRTKALFNPVEFSYQNVDNKTRPSFIVAAFAPMNILASVDRATILNQGSVPYTFTSGCGDLCQIHAGIQAAALSVKNQVMAALVALKRQYPDDDIYLTGHSMGGAIATLMALELKARHDYDANVYTMGTPAFVNLALATHISTQLQTYYRVTNARDPVPHIPIPDFVHPSGEIFYPSWGSTFFVRCFDAPGFVSFECSTLFFSSTPPDALTDANLDKLLLVPGHLQYLQEDGQLSWCAAQAPSFEKFIACYSFNADDPAQRALLLKLMATNGDWSVIDRFNVITEGTGPAYTRRTDALASSSCTIDDLKAFNDLYAEGYGSCLGSKAAERRLGPGGALMPEAGYIGQCLADPLANAHQCSIYISMELAKITRNGGDQASEALRAFQVTVDSVACLAENKRLFLESPLASSSCKLATDYKRALFYVQEPQPIECCTSREARQAFQRVRRFIARADNTKKSITNPTTLKAFKRCLPKVDVLSEDCKVVLTASQGQGLTSSTTDLGPACQVAKEYYAWLGNIQVSPSCFSGGASSRLVFYRAFYAACMGNNRSPSAVAPPVDVVPITYGQATLSNYLLTFVQVARCLNVDPANIITSFQLWDDAIRMDSTLAGALATCASNPILTSPSCIRVFYRLFEDGNANPNTLQGLIYNSGGTLCRCLVQSQASLAAVEVLAVPIASFSPEDIQSVCDRFYGNVRNIVTDNIIKSIAQLPRSPANTEPPFTQTSPIVVSLLMLLGVFPPEDADLSNRPAQVASGSGPQLNRRRLSAYPNKERSTSSRDGRDQSGGDSLPIIVGLSGVLVGAIVPLLVLGLKRAQRSDS